MPTHTRTVDNSADILDSRDVIARIDELTSERDDLQADIDSKMVGDTRLSGLTAAETALSEWEDENGDELRILLALQDEAEGTPDWIHGEALIRDSYFEDYARELADDIGAIDSKAPWPLSHIDWTAAADELKQDYFSVDFDGVTYWVRS